MECGLVGAVHSIVCPCVSKSMEVLALDHGPFTLLTVARIRYSVGGPANQRLEMRLTCIKRVLCRLAATLYQQISRQGLACSYSMVHDTDRKLGTASWRRYSPAR